MISSAILKVENEILRVLCFDFSVELPYSFLLILGKRLKVSKPLIFQAICLVNAIYFEPFCIFYPPASIAFAAIHKVLLCEGEGKAKELFHLAAQIIPLLSEEQTLEIAKRFKEGDAQKCKDSSK